MADHTNIEWTDATWNPITGCSVVSPGCTNCYAMKLAGTRLKNHPSRAGLTRESKAGPVWNGEVRLNAQWLTQPLRWKRPRMIFVCAHGDLFAEGVPDAWIDKVFAVMALAPHHTFQVLTKRPERMRDYLKQPRWRPVLDWGQDERCSYWIAEAACHIAIRLPDKGISMPEHVRTFGQLATFEHDLKTEANWPLPNVWLGVSVEDQPRADQRIPILLDTPAAIRWISAEPLLGSLNLTRWLDRLNWIVAGGESGSDARPMHPDWARSLRDQCKAADVPFLFKQWGEWGSARPVPSGTAGEYAIATAGPDTKVWPQSVIPVDAYPRQISLFGGASVRERIGKKAAGRLLDGELHDAFPKIKKPEAA